jgi:hypothetical protein
MTLEPFGYYQENLRAAMICATEANIYRDEKKHSKPYQPNDFIETNEIKKHPKKKNFQSVTQFLGMSKEQLKDIPGIIVLDQTQE